MGRTLGVLNTITEKGCSCSERSWLQCTFHSYTKKMNLLNVTEIDKIKLLNMYKQFVDEILQLYISNMFVGEDLSIPSNHNLCYSPEK